jgi:hypothetical protein
MATKKYKYGRGKNAAKAVHTDLPDGEHQAVGIGNLHVLIVPDGNFWFAQGIEIDYAAQGSTIDEAKKNFEDGLVLTIEQNLNVYQTIEGILTPAPAYIQLEALKLKGSVQSYGQVSLHHAMTEKQVAFPFYDTINFLGPKEEAA